MTHAKITTKLHVFCSVCGVVVSEVSFVKLVEAVASVYGDITLSPDIDHHTVTRWCDKVERWIVVGTIHARSE